MNSEDLVFWKLSKMPFDTMRVTMDKFHNSASYLSSLDKKADSARILKNYGWDYDEYCKALHHLD